MNDKELIQKVQYAQDYARRICEGRANLASIVGMGCTGIVTAKVEFPDLGIMHVSLCTFGKSYAEPDVYQLNIKDWKWEGLTTKFGRKLADIPVKFEGE